MLVQDLVLVGVWTVWTFCIYIYINNVFCILQFYVDISSPNYMKLTVFQTGDGMSRLNKKQINIRDNCDTECQLHSVNSAVVAMSWVSGVTPAASRWRGMLFWIVSVTIILILQLMIFHLVSNTMLFIKTEHYYGKVPILYDMIKYLLQILYSLVFVWTTKKCSKKMVEGSNSWQGPFF